MHRRAARAQPGHGRALAAAGMGTTADTAAELGPDKTRPLVEVGAPRAGPDRFQAIPKTHARLLGRAKPLPLAQ